MHSTGQYEIDWGDLNPHHDSLDNKIEKVGNKYVWKGESKASEAGSWDNWRCHNCGEIIPKGQAGKHKDETGHRDISKFKEGDPNDFITWESKASEGEGSPYAVGNHTDWFATAWGDDEDQSAIPNTVQCEYCFDQFNIDDQQGMINHINSVHDAGVDPVTGDTNKSWGESKAKEDYLGNSGGSGHGYGEQLPESIAKHYENNRWSGHDGLVDYYATCKICGKEISAFSLDKYGIHLVEEHGITESLASETNGYIAFYEDQQTEIYADTSYDAQKKAIDFFNPPESKKHTVTVMIAEQDGEQITHTFTEAIDWYSKIEDLASKSGVKRIPVENFLSTIGANDDENIAMMNFEMDSSMYNWNGQTQKAILEGIHIYFSQVK
jgi:hypothetical protein